MGWLNKWNASWMSFNKNIRMAILANIFGQVGLGIFMVIYNFYIRELGFADNMNGKIISMTSLATAIILIPAGILSDRIGRKKIILWGSFAAGILLIFRSTATSEFWLTMTAFFGGAAMAFIQVSTIPLLSENSTPSKRIQLFSMHFALTTAANVIGSIAGGIMTDGLGNFLTELTSIRITLIAGSVIFLAGVLPIFKITEHKTQPLIKAENRQVKGTSISPLIKNLKVIILFAFAQLLIGVGAGLVIPYLNLYFSDRFHASNSSIGIIISLGQAATALAMFIGPLVVKKVGEVKAVVILQMASLPFLLLTAYTHSLGLAAAGFLFRQALMNAGNPIQMSLMMGKVEDSAKGLANSINQMVFNLGWALMGPVSMGFVSQHGSYWGYAYVFTITAGLYLIGSTYFYLMFRTKKPKKTMTLAAR
ncbi:MFS transporter [Falsibacillus pallidus]|uniref:MFS transporter n=1 Tax=Falsibacillus pallidus TaxID=493781 RepID=UPI003D97C097